MESILNSREIMGQFVDALLAQKYPGQPADALQDERESAIKSLDDEVCYAIFGSLDTEQLAEINQILDTTPDESHITAFFDKVGINPEKQSSEAMQNFAKKFLGGTNE